MTFSVKQPRTYQTNPSVLYCMVAAEINVLTHSSTVTLLVINKNISDSVITNDKHIQFMSMYSIM